MAEAPLQSDSISHATQTTISVPRVSAHPWEEMCGQRHQPLQVQGATDGPKVSKLLAPQKQLLWERQDPHLKGKRTRCKAMGF